MGKLLLEVADDDWVVGEFFERSRDVVSLVLRQRLRVVPNKLSVGSHCFDLGGVQ